MKSKGKEKKTTFSATNQKHRHVAPELRAALITESERREFELCLVSE